MIGRQWKRSGLVCAIIIVLACIEPILHAAIPFSPPPGMAPSGLHTVDTYAYLSAMAHYQEACFSPYAACHDPGGVNNSSFYALPHHRMYGLLGVAARVLHIPAFLFLGIANGLGLAFLLFAAYVFLRVAVPKQADLAFALFALGGGLSGLVYVLTGVLDWHGDPRFPEYFGRFFYYELNEGPRFYPHLVMARLYYSFPLGAGLLALAALKRTMHTPRFSLDIAAGFSLAVCAFLNFRVGPMLWAVGLLGVAALPGAPWRRRLPVAVIWSFGAVLGALPAVRMMSSNPALMKSVQVLGGVMWLIPFLYATAFHWITLPGAIRRGLKALPLWLRICGGAGAGYALTYAVLYLLYQAYWGNWWSGGDDSAARAVSDPALIGAVAGGLFALFFGAKNRADVQSPDTETPETLGWLTLWFLAILCVSIAALGKGWLSQFMPQRCAVVLGVPLAALCAEGLQHWRVRWPRLANGLTAAILLCGAISIAVTWLTVHGPLGVNTMQRYYPWTNYVFITDEDESLLKRIERGVVLAPSLGDPLYGDVAVVNNPLVRTVYGNGTMDFSHEVMAEVRTRVADFFAPGTEEAARRALAEEWCVDYVLCPDGAPVDKRSQEELRRLPWLREVAAAGQGTLFEVQR